MGKHRVKYLQFAIQQERRKSKYLYKALTHTHNNYWKNVWNNARLKQKKNVDILYLSPSFMKKPNDGSETEPKKKKKKSIGVNEFTF